MKRYSVVLATLFLSAEGFAAWDVLTTKVDSMYGSWSSHGSTTVNEMCVRFTNNKIVKLDLTKPADEVNYVNLLSAKAQNSDVTLYLEIDGTLVGGCNTGNTIERHGIIIID